MVPWCHGATAPRCLGSMAPCFLGAMVPRCYGATVPWCHGALVPWCHGAMAPRQCLGVLVPWCHDAPLPCCCGATAPWRHGAAVPWCRSALQPWCRGAMVPRCLAALVPWCLCATVAWCHGAYVPRCHGALVPWHHGAKRPWCHGARISNLTKTPPWQATIRPSTRIPLVRTSSELAVRRAGKAPEGTVPSPSPDRNAATRSCRGSSWSSSPTADGFGIGTPMPSPQSQSFSQTYGSILSTSLAYIISSTRGCSPLRPDAVMSTTGYGRHSVLQIFKGYREHTGHHATCGALPTAGPYLRLSRFQGGQAVKQKR
ncbi:hypothetical protein CQW23_33472 [Capsicum baccatum]|uniref:Protein TAR1 n=1 Tax=Capsicum baccatum TaxID=33114 RepID=A0A2G2V1R8_CAPBA|nr:hypothetical protein CQW23_33472 [Capsicum baccatum]